MACAARVHWTDELGLTAFDVEYIDTVEHLLEATVSTPPTQKIGTRPGEWLVWIEPV